VRHVSCVAVSFHVRRDGGRRLGPSRDPSSPSEAGARKRNAPPSLRGRTERSTPLLSHSCCDCLGAPRRSILAPYTRHCPRTEQSAALPGVSDRRTPRTGPTDTGWFGVSWTPWHEAALWHSESALGPWAWVEGFHTEQRTYENGLNVIGGSLIWRWSNADGSQRPNSGWCS
jgi:hypothetical protein